MPAPTLHIRLLGDFALIYDDQPVTTVNIARLQMLLAYLVLHRHVPQTRQHLAYLFWPDSTEDRARTNLRGVLYRLRGVLPDIDRYMLAEGNMLRWSDTAPFTLDVAEFEEAVAAAERNERAGNRIAAQAAFERAVALYQGELLPDCYDDWILAERVRLQKRFVNVLERLIVMLERHRDYVKAIEHAQRLLQQDPLHEASYRTLMRLHALNDDRASALRVYHACVTTLQRELGIMPSLTTRELYERLIRADAAPLMPLDLDQSRDEGESERWSARDASRTPALVGRDKEWNALQDSWQMASNGKPYCVMLVGEAGIGKTRLAEELVEWVKRQGMTTAVARCYAAEGTLAYAPVTAWLRSRAIHRRVNSLEPAWLNEIARLLPEVQEEHPELPRPEPVAEPWQRQQLFEALARAVLRATQPILLVLDDAQWCDHDTLEWLHYLLRYDERARLMILGTVRVEEAGVDHPLASMAMSLLRNKQLAEIELSPLSAQETETLASHVIGQSLGPTEASHLHTETEGNPLFVVETIRAAMTVAGERYGSHSSDVREAAGRQRSTFNIRQLGRLPPSIQAVIARRLAQLPPDSRELVNLAAVIGREFQLPVLRSAGVGEYDEAMLVRSLDELWRRRILRELGSDAYDFTHDKLREIAYSDLSEVRRKFLHRHVAEALEKTYAHDLDSVSAQVAVHYEHAGMFERAVQRYQQAAAVAQRLYANEESIAHLQKALALLPELPDTPDRARQELALLMALFAPLIATRGYASDEVGEAKRRAWELCQWVGNTLLLTQLAGELWNFHAVKAEWHMARQFAEDHLRLAYQTEDPISVLEAYRCLDETLMFLGEFGTARTYPDWDSIMHDVQRHGLRQGDVIVAARDPVALLSFVARFSWCLGYPDRSIRKVYEAIALAESMPDPYYLTFARSTAAQMHHFRGEWQALRDQVDPMLDSATRYGFAYLMAGGRFLHGWLLANIQHRVAEGIARMQEALEQWRRTGAGLWQPYLLALLAETHWRERQIEPGLAVIAEAHAIVERTGERLWLPELHRLEGELLRLQAGIDDMRLEMAAACFQQAVQAARQQGSKSLELRAATSLGRLWQAQGRHDEARQLLAAIYGWFTEGFDTADLKEARVLLEAL